MRSGNRVPDSELLCALGLSRPGKAKLEDLRLIRRQGEAEDVLRRSLAHLRLGSSELGTDRPGFHPAQGRDLIHGQPSTVRNERLSLSSSQGVGTLPTFRSLSRLGLGCGASGCPLILPVDLAARLSRLYPPRRPRAAGSPPGTVHPWQRDLVQAGRLLELRARAESLVKRSSEEIDEHWESARASD